MESFIDKFIDELLAKHKNSFNDTCIVFPTRRACIIFKNKLTSKLKQASWLPAVYSISDFVTLVSPYKILQRPALLLKLFPVYRQFYTNSTYNNFIGWGEMMLKDFDEIDRYLIDKDVLFGGIEKIKEIDAEFQFSEEERNDYAEFWKNFSNKELSSSKETFLKTWKVLPQIYDRLQAELVSSNCNYEGFVYRLIAVSPNQFLNKLMFKYFHFAGFYALSPAEEKIMQHLISEGRATVYWDADNYYLNNPKQEAGKFIRESEFQLPEVKWSGNYFENGNKSIEIIGVNGKTLMARHAGVILENVLKSNQQSEGETAMVLPEESMLIPVLNSLPANIQNLNVTMGFSIKDHFFYSLFKSIKKINDTKKQRGEGLLVFTDSIRELFNDVALTQNTSPSFFKVVNDYKKIRSSYLDINIVWGSINDMETGSLKELLKLIFDIPNDTSNIYNYLNSILNWLADNESNATGGVFGNKNLLQHLHISFSEFIEEVKSDTKNFDESSIWQLLNDFFGKFKFPFSGEPVLGLQLMGFLETRVLDFKTLIITNVNEGVLPSDSSRNSFVPFSIRKAFKLPTFLNQDAIFAYHFFRLLQRAENVFLLYNTEVNSSSGGEMSRYILQVVYELQQKFSKNIFIKHKLVSEGIATYNNNDINITRDENLTTKLVNLFKKNAEEESFKRFTPSSINTYVYCPFKFYLHYVQGLKEDETIEESMQANEFGNVFHKTVEQLYLPFLNTQINADTIKKLIPETGAAVNNAIKQEYDKYYVSEGENYLFEKVLEELVSKTLQQDEAYAPFKLIALETEYSQWIDLGNKISVNLFGKFDRVDQKDGLTRVIDYKTGNADLAKETLPEDLFTNTDHKINLQLLIYNQLVSHNLPEQKTLCGVYALKQTSEGIKYLAGNNAVNNQTAVEFFSQLKDFLRTIIYESDFKQTSDFKKCENCGFRRLCNR